MIPDFHYFAQHLERVAHDIQTATVIVNGLHADLLHHKTEALCQHQYFRIKAPTLNALAGENQPRSFALERLEATLGIFEAQPENRANYSPEANAAQAPVPGSS